MKKVYDFGMKWNDRLRQARDAANIKNTDIASALKVSDPTVNGWMTGKTINIEARHLLPLCKLLDVSPFWIMFEDETELDISTLPGSVSVPAIEIIRLITLYAQSTADGRRRIIDLATLVGKAPPT